MYNLFENYLRSHQSNRDDFGLWPWCMTNSELFPFILSGSILVSLFLILKVYQVLTVKAPTRVRLTPKIHQLNSLRSWDSKTDKKTTDHFLSECEGMLVDAQAVCGVMDVDAL